ncbi:pyoverdine biosynthesis protein PvcA [Legionella quinlivanii]|uniref:Pyoverdine biosynthesis protein PvcA n=1 Tax=Legionella quinlivanii TaxID=45073 RepID=A0A0W0Y2Y7_9GAMM|nr:L-tyrosine/L-tryptophan isonitrile synthase family protein [Legionella quinlivanii]KTD51431.1 pyoverdine biosynthesis protein PvcA [Legionella quinlivanii]SEG10869.1 Pyoverdine/dityrosine biosynthesis protein [Legionella quinlivanii DSM 21216]STY10191.1 pyoverdine biosynthesis protein PvcA [Legionella quinlivanii]
MNKTSPQKTTCQVGLDQKNEAVISAHFMDKINGNSELDLYTSEAFLKRATYVSPDWMFNGLIPVLLNASQQFVTERVAAVKKRVLCYFREYGLNEARDIGTAECIAEVMFDRQFLKGRKSNYSRLALAAQIKELIKNKQPVKMVIPALPYKSSSPLKSRGILPDLSEVNFLLSLAEIARTITLIYGEQTSAPPRLAKFTVISDGSRFNRFLNEPLENIHHYQQRLNWWIDQLKIGDYVEIADYQQDIVKSLPKTLWLQKNSIRNQVIQLYSEVMIPILNPLAMTQTLNDAIARDPDPETDYAEGRFVPLFKSLLYTISYQCLQNYALIHGMEYDRLYTEIMRRIFKPYQTADKEQEDLRQAMLQEAWLAAIHYIAEIRSDRDLDDDPVLVCFPDAIRWTIHAKRGQLALLTTAGQGDPVQPWHGSSICQLTRTSKIKFYTHPVLLLEGKGATPILVEDPQDRLGLKNQPLFYVSADICFKDSGDLLHQIENLLTRKRKL